MNQRKPRNFLLTEPHTRYNSASEKQVEVDDLYAPMATEPSKNNNNHAFILRIREMTLNQNVIKDEHNRDFAPLDIKLVLKHENHIYDMISSKKCGSSGIESISNKLQSEKKINVSKKLKSLHSEISHSDTMDSRNADFSIQPDEE